MADEGDILLEVRNLKAGFRSREGLLRAVNDVSFTVHRGRTLGVVGESGCGKSVTAQSILRLVPSTSSPKTPISAMPTPRVTEIPTATRTVRSPRARSPSSCRELLRSGPRRGASISAISTGTGTRTPCSRSGTR